MRVCGSIVGALALLLALPALAAAKPGCHHHQTPSGNSEADQYTEVIPGGCGSHKPNPPSTTNSGGPSSGSIPPATLQQLQSQGPAGANAAGLAEANAPASAETGGGPGTGSNPGGTGAQGQGAASHGSRSGAKGGSGGGGQSDGSFLKGLGDALGGTGGAGFILPLILGATLLAGLAYWLVRRRRPAATG
jgi:LPXTG-motif cell wall-anchored protein